MNGSPATSHRRLYPPRDPPATHTRVVSVPVIPIVTRFRTSSPVRELRSRATLLVERNVPRPAMVSMRKLVVWQRYRRLSAADALFVSYPKSGSTWLRFILGNIFSEADTDWDSVRASTPPLGYRREGSPILAGNGRLVRTHEPLDPWYRPFGRQVVYLVRDGRDVAVSMLNSLQTFQAKLNPQFQNASVSEFLAHFLEGAGHHYGRWHTHVELALDAQSLRPGEVLTVRYEDLLQEPVDQVARVLDFLLVTAERSQIERAVSANTLDRMRSKEAASNSMVSRGQAPGTFVRRGSAGAWSEHFTSDDRKLFAEVAGSALNRAGYSP